LNLIIGLVLLNHHLHRRQQIHKKAW